MTNQRKQVKFDKAKGKDVVTYLYRLGLTDAAGVFLKQLLLLIRRGGFEFFFVSADRILQFPVILAGGEVAYSVGSIFPYQNSSKMLIPCPPRRLARGGRSPQHS